MSSDKAVFEVVTKFEVEKFYLKDSLPEASVNVKREEQAQESLEVWESFSDEYRQALCDIVSKSLEFLHSSVASWAPFCILTGTAGGDKIDLIMSIMLSDLESQVDIFSEGTNFEVESAKRRLASEISGEVAELNDEDFLAEVKEHLDRGSRPTVASVERLMDMFESKGTTSFAGTFKTAR